MSRPEAIPLTDLASLFAEFNQGTERAKRDYYGRDYYDRQNARSGATRRSLARKKAKETS